MHYKNMSIALNDIGSALARWPLVGMLGWQDVKQRYRRSMLGPFWLTLSMGITIAIIGFVFGQIFKMSLREYLPYLATGMILWVFISTVVTEGCLGFISAEGIIKQLPMPLYVHILRVIWRNTLIFCHNIVILPLLFLLLGKPVGWAALLCLPGFILTTLNLAWVALLLGILCARYRDLPQIITSALQVAFYLTPIMWVPSLLPQQTGAYLLDWNPVFHLVEIVRAPLVGGLPSALNWLVALALAAGGWLLTLMLYSRYKRRIAYWL